MFSKRDFTAIVAPISLIYSEGKHINLQGSQLILKFKKKKYDKGISYKRWVLSKKSRFIKK